MSQLDRFALIARISNAQFAFNTSAQVDLGIGATTRRCFACARGINAWSPVICLSKDGIFFADVAPSALGHKALAVNLSDLAAMGADPIGFTLSIGLPSVDEAWLARIHRGACSLCPSGFSVRSSAAIPHAVRFWSSM